MGRIIKLLGLLLGAVVLLLVIVAVAVGVFFDPNDYRDQIEAAVADATGRELSLDGELELSVFPNIRIVLGPAELANAPGFGAAPFARIETAILEVSLLPLLFRRVEIDEARLDGLTLNLARNAAGIDNWQDIGAGAAPADGDAAAPSGDGAADIDMNVRVIEVSNANVTWNDAATGSSWELNDFGLEAEDFGTEQSFPLAMQFGLAGAELSVDVAADMRATLSLVDNSYQLDDLNVRIGGEGPAWPGGAGDAELSFDTFIANLEAETLDLRNLSLDFLGLNVTGSLEGRNLMRELSLSGAVDIAEFDPKALLGIFDAAIETADPDVLRSASARANFVYSASETGLRDLQLSLDDSELAGFMAMQGDIFRFSLDLDEINIDRYLPPATEGDTPPDEGSIDEVDLPLELLRTLRAAGDFDLGQAQFTGLRLSDARFTFTAGDGRVRLEPSASLYGGTSEGDIRIEVDGDTANFAIVERVSNVDMQPLARDYLDIEELSGTGTITLDLTSSGANLGAMKRDLDGDVAFSLTDGAWSGIDFWYELRRLRAVTDGADAPERPAGARETRFSNVSASGVVTDAVLTNEDFNATLPFMAVNGSGTVNLLTNAIDFDLDAGFTDGPTLQSDPRMAELAGSSLPLSVGGTLDAPAIRPDFGALVRERAREEVQERVDEERNEVEERVDEEREEVEERVRDRLRGLFD